MNYLANAFSLQMIETFPAVPIIETVTSDEIPTDVISCIGHADTANILSNILKRIVPYNRQNVTIKKGDILYVAQIMGGRLPEGTTTLPEGMEIRFNKIRIMYKDQLCIRNDGTVCEMITPCYRNCDLDA